jgi:hypothetical protein
MSALSSRTERCAAAQLAFGELGEPALDEVQPRRAGRREVQLKARMGGQPALDRRCLVGGVVVEHEVHVELGWHLVVDRLQEPLELERAVTGVQRADHLAAGRVERGEQARSAVALVVVRAALRHARQQRLAAIERLNLGLLVDAQHQRALRRVQVQADDVSHLLDEQRVLGELPVLDAVRLQPERPPHPGHRRLRDARHVGHLTRRPVRAPIRRRRFQRPHDDLLDLGVSDRSRPSRPRLVEQPVQPPLGKPRPPLGHRRPADPEPLGDPRVALAGRGRQHDPAAHRQPGSSLAPPRPALQLLALAVREVDRDRLRSP